MSDMNVASLSSFNLKFAFSISRLLLRDAPPVESDWRVDNLALLAHRNSLR